MQALKNIIRWGVSPQLLEDIQEKVILTNKVNLILVLSNIILFPVTFRMPAVFAINVLGLLIVSGSLVANRLSFTNAARFLTSNYGMVIISVAHGIMLRPGEPPLASIIALCMAVAPLAFVLFAAVEWKKVVGATVFNLILFMSYPLWSRLLYDGAIYQDTSSSSRQLYTMFFSFLIMSGVLYLQLRSNRQMSAKNQQMVKSLQQNQQETETTQQELQHTLEEVQQARQEDEKRNWASEGLTQVTRIIREHEDLKELCDHLISYIVKYVKANQGGMFILSENEDDSPEKLELMSCFAYERKKFLQKHIAIGEGLVGQAYLEKEHVYMTEIPPAYVNITSGLGKATPSSLLVIPMMVNDTVEGILEIASFQEFDEHEITFLKNAGETVASSLRSIKMNAQTRNLLYVSQQQAEEMRATEEEMRQNMEEMQATQEETYRKEQEYIRRIEELEQRVTTDA